MTIKTILALLTIITIASCSKDCTHDVAEKQILWEESRPNHYSFEYSNSCFCSVESVGPFYVEITGETIDTAYYIGPEEVLNSYETMLNDYEHVKTLVDANSIDTYFDRYADEGQSGSSDFDCAIVYDNQYHFISSYEIIPPDDIADGDFLHKVTNFINLD